MWLGSQKSESPQESQKMRLKSNTCIQYMFGVSWIVAYSYVVHVYALCSYIMYSKKFARVKYFTREMFADLHCTCNFGDTNLVWNSGHAYIDDGRRQKNC